MIQWWRAKNWPGTQLHTTGLTGVEGGGWCGRPKTPFFDASHMRCGRGGHARPPAVAVRHRIDMHTHVCAHAGPSQHDQHMIDAHGLAYAHARAHNDGQHTNCDDCVRAGFVHVHACMHMLFALSCAHMCVRTRARLSHGLAGSCHVHTCSGVLQCVTMHMHATCATHACHD